MNSMLQHAVYTMFSVFSMFSVFFMFVEPLALLLPDLEHAIASLHAPPHHH